MKTLKIWSLVLACALVMLAGQMHAKAALYGDKGKDAVSGDLNDQDYWWTKFDMMMLDLALKQEQPEGRIGLNLVSTQKRLEDLQGKYPKHEDIKKWKAHVDDVISKISPDADRGASFKPGMPWEEANYAQLWVNFHYAQTLMAVGDYGQALSMLQNVEQNYEFLLKPDRMKNYPEDLRKWVVDNKPEADKMVAECKEKLK